MDRQLEQFFSAYAAAYPEEREKVSRFEALLGEAPRSFERDFFSPGHFTGSCWLVNADHSKVLLTHHRKLGRWLQLGGHADGDTDLLGVSLREAHEESGLEKVVPLLSDIFDIDVHTIPARGEEPAHLHYDVRYLLQVSGNDKPSISAESLDLQWVSIRDFELLPVDESMRRLARKHRAWLER